MRAELKSIFAWDIDLATWTPADTDFGIPVVLFIGVVGEHTSDAFDVTLCTPGWFAQRMKESPVASGQHTLFVSRHDYRALEAYITDFVSRCDGETWPEIAAKLNHLGRWEFAGSDTRIDLPQVINR